MFYQVFFREGGDEEKHFWRHSENPGNRPTARFTTVIEKVEIVEKNFINIINIITNSINNFTNVINIFRFPGRPDTMMTRFIVYTELKSEELILITFLQTQRVGGKKEIFEPPLHYSDDQMSLRQYYKTISNTDSSYENYSEEHLEERRAALELYLNSLLTKLVSIHNIIKIFNILRS